MLSMVLVQGLMGTGRGWKRAGNVLYQYTDVNDGSFLRSRAVVLGGEVFVVGLTGLASHNIGS